MNDKKIYYFIEGFVGICLEKRGCGEVKAVRKISQRKLEDAMTKKWLKMLYKKGTINAATYKFILLELNK